MRATSIEGVERLGVGDVGVVDPAGVLPVAVLRPDARDSRARPRAEWTSDGLAVVVLQDVAEAAVQHAGLPKESGAAWSPDVVRPPARLDADQPHLVVLDERIEHAGRVAAAAHAGHDHVGQPAELRRGTAAASRGR